MELTTVLKGKVLAIIKKLLLAVTGGAVAASGFYW